MSEFTAVKMVVEDTIDMNAESKWNGETGCRLPPSTDAA